METGPNDARRIIWALGKFDPTLSFRMGRYNLMRRSQYFTKSSKRWDGTLCDYREFGMIVSRLFLFSFTILTSI